MAKKSRKEKERERKKRKILFILILFVFTVLLLTSATYAWFSSNKNGLIESIDINVATVNGLQISANAIDWSNELKKEDLINATETYRGAFNQLPDTLYGVSTDGSVVNGRMNMFYGSTDQNRDGGYTITSTQETEINCVGDVACAGHHYIAFDVFLLTQTPVNLVVTANSSVVNRDTYDTGGQNSARIAFVNEGTVPVDSSYLAAQNIMGGNSSIIWEPNYDVHTAGGVEQARRFYDINTSMNGGARLNYRGINREFKDPVLLTETDTSPYFSPVNPDIATTKGFDTDQPLTSIPGGITKFRIYMWLEGEDVDLENNAADGKLTFNLEVAMTSEH